MPQHAADVWQWESSWRVPIVRKAWRAWMCAPAHLICRCAGCDAQRGAARVSYFLVIATSGRCFLRTRGSGPSRRSAQVVALFIDAENAQGFGFGEAVEIDDFDVAHDAAKICEMQQT